MSGTSKGSTKGAKTNKKLYGDDFYRKMGSIGGKAKGLKGFALMSREKRVAAGKIGGKVPTGQGKVILTRNYKFRTYHICFYSEIKRFLCFTNNGIKFGL